MALKGCTKPDPWVTVANPATAPEMPPSALAFLFRSFSASIHATAPAAAAMWVATNALEASEEAPNALPALNPNQPTQSRQAPMKLRVMLWGTIFSLG